MSKTQLFWPGALCTAALSAVMGWVGLAQASTTDLASSPLETSSASSVKPNIFVIMDDSGSMSYTYLPDWAAPGTTCSYISASTTSGRSTTITTGSCSTSSAGYAIAYHLYENPKFNGIWYDPAVTYSPPVTYDGTSYSSMTSANTSAWTKVPVDAYKVVSTSTVNLTSSAPVYYVSIPGEYCTSSNLRTCATQSAASTAYPYAAYLRWCTAKDLATCQATRIETAPTGGSTYLYPRFPTALTSSGTTVAGSMPSVTIQSSTTTYAYPGSSTRASTRTDCTTNSTTCTYAEEMTNYANWYAYYRTRNQTMKTAASQAFVDLSTSYRLGYMTINNANGSDFLDIADITTTSGGQKSQFYTKMFAAKPSGSTPLKKALYTAGRYFAGKLSTINSVSSSDPMEYACQKNFTIVATDGYWNETTTPYQIDGSTQIGNQDGSEDRPYYDGNGATNTLADIAEYYYKTDIRSSTFSNTTNRSTGTDVSSNSYSNGQQRMYTYTLGLGASGYMQYDSSYATATSGDYYDVANGTATSSSTLSSGVCIWQSSGSCNWPTPKNNSQTGIDDLWHAAVNGRGTYYSAGSPAELKEGLTDFVNSVSATMANSASVAASTVNLTESTDAYAFATWYCSAKWYGEFARYSIDASTGDVASSPDWAESGAPSECSSSSTTTTAVLDGTTWSARKIYTYDPTNTSSSLISFNWDSLTSTMKTYFQMAHISGLSQMCTSGTSCLASSSQVDSTTAGTTTGAGGINLVNFLRGDRSNEGTSSSSYYFARTHVLGDIVNAQPVYVGAPSYSYTDSGYSSYKSSQSSRTPMVYIGANDGMLHAFQVSNGAETWAYIPSMLLPNLYKLADKNYASNHANFVDGGLTKADVYYSGAWHTILVGGLGQGGRGFYALDVTTPSSPTVLWEFTYNTSAGSNYIMDADLGYSYGTPIVTKLSDGTWVVLVTSGYNNVSPGTGHGILWVLNAATGAVIQKIDNGMGSSSGTVTGCSTAPCPSGLAKVAGWVDSSTNNLVTQVYGGDLYGNVWRFDISSLTASGGSATTQLLATLSDGNGTRQPVTAAPELGYPNSQQVVYVGTGEYLGTSDMSTTQTQSVYAIKDPLTGSSTTSAIYSNPRSLACSSSTETDCFVKNVLTDSSGTRTASAAISGISMSFSSKDGWFADLPESGERVNTDLSLASGTLVVLSNAPTVSNACSQGGSSWLNYFSYTTGLAVSGNTVGVLISSSSLASGATLVKTSTGAIKAIVSLSDGSTTTKDIPSSSSSTGTRRLFWRELPVSE